MKLIKYTDNLYENRIFLVYSTWSEFKNFLKKQKTDFFLEDIDKENPEGFSFYIPELSDSYIYIKKESKFNLRTFVHELNHVCIAIFERKGIPITSNCSEPYCYYFDFLFDYFYNKIKL